MAWTSCDRKRRRKSLCFPRQPYSGIWQQPERKVPFCLGRKTSIGKKKANSLSLNLLLEAGATVFTAGHAERRVLFGEEDEIINRKVRRTLKEGLRTVLCIGELSSELTPDQLEAELENQLRASLSELEITDMTQLVIAYEPYWAIGRGRSKVGIGQPAFDCYPSDSQVIRRNLW
jgi:hypothetical protein